jgi:hypothetical protein
VARFSWAALGLDKSKVEVTVYNSKDFSIKGKGNMSHLVDRCVRVCAGVCAGVSVHGMGLLHRMYARTLARVMLDIVHAHVRVHVRQ